MRLLPGVFIATDVWDALTPLEQHLALTRAVAPHLRDGSVFSHATAAMIHGWPWIGDAEERVHVLDPAVAVIQHRSGVVRHPGRPTSQPDPVAFDGVPVTSALDTAVTLAATVDHHVAAVAVDAAVRSGTLTPDQLHAAVPQRPARGSVRAAAVIDALDANHESVGESFAAARFVQLGLPRWTCQASVRHHAARSTGSTSGSRHSGWSSSSTDGRSTSIPRCCRAETQPMSCGRRNGARTASARCPASGRSSG